mgnify:CR=1 FL=1
MGLDSIELIVHVEDRFKIEISDHEACRIYTVKDLMDCICSKVQYTSKNSIYSQEVSEKFSQIYTSITNNPLDYHSALNKQTTSDLFKQFWSRLQNDFNIPRQPNKAKLLLIKKVKPLTYYSPYQLIDWIVCLNFAKNMKVEMEISKYDILHIIKGILMNNYNVPHPKIQLESRFRNDLGLD